MSQYLVGRWGEPATWPREPEKVLLGLDAFIERNLLEETGESKERRARVRVRAVLVADERSGQPGPRPGRAAGAISVLGAEPAHQAREHRRSCWSPTSWSS